MNKTQEQTGHFLYPPGGILIWLIVVVELFTFGGAFLFFFVERSEQIDLFKASQNLLNRDLATINTLVLITSGFFAANAAALYKGQKLKGCTRSFLMAGSLGLVFVGIKCFEYYQKILLGKTLGTNTFFDFYWMLTGFHLVHVLLGIFLIAAVSWQVTNSNERGETGDNVETVATFWHLCDLIWIFLFPVIYLI